MLLYQRSITERDRTRSIRTPYKLYNEQAAGLFRQRKSGPPDLRQVIEYCSYLCSSYSLHWRGVLYSPFGSRSLTAFVNMCRQSDVCTLVSMASQGELESALFLHPPCRSLSSLVRAATVLYRRAADNGMLWFEICVGKIQRNSQR